MILPSVAHDLATAGGLPVPFHFPADMARVAAEANRLDKQSTVRLTTHQYVEADLAMKERALARLHEPAAKIQRYTAPDSLLALSRRL